MNTAHAFGPHRGGLDKPVPLASVAAVATPVARWTVVVGLILSIGLHWYALQLLAWANMIRLDAPEKGLTTSIVTVLNGVETCDFCDAIRSARFERPAGEDTPVTPRILRVDRIDKDAPRVTLIVFSAAYTRLPVAREQFASPSPHVAEVPVPPPEFA